MAEGPSRRFRFGVFEADLDSGDLRHQGLRVRLRGKPFEILGLLLERSGQVVSRDELRSRLWSADTFVDFDHGLNAAMNKLRETLGDSADNPRFVETIPRRGYRFIAPVTPVSPEGGGAQGAAPAPGPPAAPAETVHEAGPRRPALPRRAVLGTAAALALLLAGYLAATRPASPQRRAGPLRLAVLPFHNTSGDAEQDYFVDGMTEALIAELAQVSSLRVISRTSVMPYKSASKKLPEIARELDVDAVVEGAAVRSGDRVRITAQLIEASSDRHLWARSYDCELGDVLDVQRRVAREVTDQIRVAVTPSERERLSSPAQVDPAAHEAYLRGTFLRERMVGDSLRRSIAYFEEAVARDPEYAAAHAGLADAYWIVGVPGYELMPPRETAPKARAAAERALELDPDLPTPRATLAAIAYWFDWDFAAAEERMAALLREHPGFARGHIWYSAFLTGLQRHERSVAEARLGLELDPLSAAASQTLGMRLFYGGRHGEAIAAFGRRLELDPGAFVARLGLAQCLWRSGRLREALTEAERAHRDSGGSLWALSWLGHLRAAAGDGAGARAVLDELRAESGRRYVPAFYSAVVLAALGETEAALGRLDTAFEERSGWMAFLNVEPGLEPLRGRPRFRQLLGRVGLAATPGP